MLAVKPQPNTGKYEFLRFLLLNEQLDINATDNNKRNALHGVIMWCTERRERRHSDQIASTQINGRDPLYMCTEQRHFDQLQSYASSRSGGFLVVDHDVEIMLQLAALFERGCFVT